MTVSAKTADFPEDIWIGKKKSEWPLFTFASEKDALKWAADGTDSYPRYVIRVTVSDLTKARTASVVPEKVAWDA